MPELRKPRVVTNPQIHLAPRRRRQQQLQQQPGTDIRQTKEYKVAARRWISVIVALPVFMYTSYVLFERTYGNQKQKRLGDVKSDQDTK
ncbi:hypothetical protein P175DRAFT_0497218 [Aspergillus ochraceoroseus IBT 24754]|uniref:Uncharacterized protein n=1 Tax=Aspergillus ochraceoroseus IBT 24754 TaxID=1392256 RepID=A0A2T5M6E1_9EURO|nr:uncharacterized protein P175DRAFT_0497218 [Aspergillus ochraceoroseus IBT 24754]PTU24102.1 hypothetical protein P175DRAFT_0497218 [Aspergillus ochraceoroseus IBT 24754]